VYNAYSFVAAQECDTTNLIGKKKDGYIKQQNEVSQTLIKLQ